MDLGAKPTARTTECLILLLGLCAGSAAMRSDDGAVDHLQHVQCAAAVRQHLKQQVPDARPAPATELLPHEVPFSERRRQVAPRRSGPADPDMPSSRADGCWVDARHARRAQPARARRTPTLRPSSVRGSSSASSLPRGRSRLTAGRSIVFPDITRQRNEPRARNDHFFGIRRGGLCFAFRLGQPIDGSPPRRVGVAPPKARRSQDRFVHWA